AVSESRAGLMAEAIERMERAYAVIADDEPDADLALLLVRLGANHWQVGDRDRASELTERALDIGEALLLPEVVVAGWITRARLLYPRRPEETRGIYELALRTANTHELQQLATRALSDLSDQGFQRDRYADSLTHLQEAFDLARRIGVRNMEW